MKVVENHRQVVVIGTYNHVVFFSIFEFFVKFIPSFENCFFAYEEISLWSVLPGN